MMTCAWVVPAMKGYLRPCRVWPRRGHRRAQGHCQVLLSGYSPPITTDHRSWSSSLWAVTRPYDWSSPSWNWGYAEGDAHEAAAALRAKLSVKKQDLEMDRSAFLLDPNSQIDELLLVLMLAIQARGPEDFVNVLTDLAAGRISVSKDTPLLIKNLQAAREEFDNDPDTKFEDGLMMQEYEGRLAKGEYKGKDEELRRALVLSAGVMRVVTLAF